MLVSTVGLTPEKHSIHISHTDDHRGWILGGKLGENEKAAPALSPGQLSLKLGKASGCSFSLASRRRGPGGGGRHAVKVLKEIIACIKIFTPAEGLQPFPGALSGD